MGLHRNAMVALACFFCYQRCTGQVTSMMEVEDVDKITATIRNLKLADGSFATVEDGLSYALTFGPDASDACSFYKEQLGRLPSKPETVLSYGYATCGSKEGKNPPQQYSETIKRYVEDLTATTTNPISTSAEVRKFANAALALAVTRPKHPEVDFDTVLSFALSLMAEKNLDLSGGVLPYLISEIASQASSGISQKAITAALQALNDAARFEKAAIADSPTFYTSSPLHQSRSLEFAALTTKAYFSLLSATSSKSSKDVLSIPEHVLTYLEVCMHRLNPNNEWSRGMLGTALALRAVRTAADSGAVLSTRVSVSTQTKTATTEVDIEARVFTLLGGRPPSDLKLTAQSSQFTSGENRALKQQSDPSIFKLSLKTSSDADSDNKSEGKKSDKSSIKIAAAFTSANLKQPVQFKMTRMVSNHQTIRIKSLSLTPPSSSSSKKTKSEGISINLKEGEDLPSQPIKTSLHLNPGDSALLTVHIVSTGTKDVPTFPSQVGVLFRLLSPSSGSITDIPEILRRPRQIMMSRAGEGFSMTLEATPDKKYLPSIGGRYSVTLIISSSDIINPITWHLGEMTILLPSSTSNQFPLSPRPDGTLRPVSVGESAFVAQPLIHHTFKPPPQKANPLASLVFLITAFLGAGYIAAAFWPKAGANISLLLDPMGTSSSKFFTQAFVFQGLIISQALLVIWYWLSREVWKTLQLLIILSFLCVIVGSRLLSSLRERRLQQASAISMGEKKKK